MREAIRPTRADPPEIYLPSKICLCEQRIARSNQLQKESLCALRGGRGSRTRQRQSAERSVGLLCTCWVINSYQVARDALRRAGGRGVNKKRAVNN